MEGRHISTPSKRRVEYEQEEGEGERRRRKRRRKKKIKRGRKGGGAEKERREGEGTLATMRQYEASMGMVSAFTTSTNSCTSSYVVYKVR